jgi:16S rRNA (cytosine1402-N4)-methyltransferase
VGIGNYHEPVLLDESIQALQIIPDGIYVDVTYGGGGHTRKILEALGPAGRLLAFDQDEEAQPNLPGDQRLIFVPHNFRHLLRFVRFHGIASVDGVLADLGVSSHQFDMPQRGFSYRYPEAPLDMRMDRNQQATAADLLNSLDPAELQRLLGTYGEVRNARTLARALVDHRHHRPYRTVGDLLDVVQPLIRGDRFRYLAQVFQALRIAVNDEMGALADMLKGAMEVLKPGGYLVVITYHSLEDRMVKRFMRDGNAEGVQQKDAYGRIHRPFEWILKTPVTPGDEEISRNTRAHSARLRVARKS